VKNSTKHCLYFFAGMTLFTASCKLDPPILPAKTDSTSTTTTTTTGSNGTGANTTSGTYQPVTSGSYWIYKNVQNGTTDTVKTSLDGNTQDVNGTTFYEGSTLYYSSGISTMGYLSNSNHIYIDRSTTGVTVNLYYLNDTTAVGHSWTAAINETGSVNGVPGQVVGTIVQKGISKVVNGKTYTNVIHSSMLLQYDFGSGFATSATYDFYAALNVGIIEIDSQTTGLTSVETLMSYQIK
jgi:hypothetical protein